MPQKFAFTTAAMAAALEETPVSYEDLADIERGFDDAETEIIRQQVALTAPLYTRRTKITSQIPNFWPLVLEQAPPDIDQYIQPSDSALLLSSLLSLHVSHFEIEDEKTSGGDPRSVAIKWEFSSNDYFEDTKLEKKFWYRRSLDGGWSGLVSEPVRIKWKKGKDLTGGLLDMVCNAWEVEKKEGNRGGEKKKELTKEQKVLKKKIESTGMGGMSFFAWFGYIGRRISAEESKEANAREERRREQRKNGGKIEEAEEEEDEEVDEDEEDLEIFPDGDGLAIALTEDLWPEAIKYFTQAQEQDALSDADFESDDEEEEDDEAQGSGSDGERPSKKRRSS
ncbi:nap family protein [Rutstroemia sp. NJR-2017a WRK4]|nr:nap family protein [Rutstroemia sp. NJR-2017a WRK4]